MTKAPDLSKNRQKWVQKNLCTAFTEVNKKEGSMVTGTVSRMGYIPEKKGSWSGRRGSNSLPPPWQGGALPDELRPHTRSHAFAFDRWCPRSESNQRHADFQSAALPTELQGHKDAADDFGGNNRARTCDPLLVRQMLSQLSYAPIASSAA